MIIAFEIPLGSPTMLSALLPPPCSQFEVSDDQDSVQMLTRSSQVGEFYVMSPPQNAPPWNAGAGCCDILIYDEESDRHIRIKWEDAVRATLCGGGTANDITDHSAGWKVAADLWSIINQGDHANEAAFNQAYANATGKTFKAVAPATAGKRVHVVVARPFIEHMMHSAVVAVAGRDTGATLFGPAGAFLSHAPNPPHPTPPRPSDLPLCPLFTDMQISVRFFKTLFFPLRFEHQTSQRAATSRASCSSEPTSGTPRAKIFVATSTMLALSLLRRPTPRSRRSKGEWRHSTHRRRVASSRYGLEPYFVGLWRRQAVLRARRHYTGHFKSVVTKAQNVFVMRDISCAGYVAGGNCDWFTLNNDAAKSARTFAEVQAAIMNRLSFTDDVSARYPSMFAFPMMDEQWESGNMDTVMSVTNRVLPWEVANNGGSAHDSFPGRQEMFDHYKANFNLHQIHYGEDMKAQENMEFISQGSVNNALCFLGPHRKYNDYSRTTFELVPGQGHFGPDAIPGVRVTRKSSLVRVIVLPMTSIPILFFRMLAGVGEKPFHRRVQERQWCRWKSPPIQCLHSEHVKKKSPRPILTGRGLWTWTASTRSVSREFTSGRGWCRRLLRVYPASFHLVCTVALTSYVLVSSIKNTNSSFCVVSHL